LPLELHELVDPSAGTVQRLDDRAIARLVLDGGKQPEKLDLFQPSLGPPRDDFRQPQRGADVEAQRPPS
jgi:hypothetical protein